MGLFIAGSRVVSGDTVLVDGWVQVANGRIARVGSGPLPAGATADRRGAIVVPGFVDLHVHGGGGASFDSGAAPDVETVVRCHRQHGTTTMVASLVSAARGRLLDLVGGLAPLVEDGTVAGLHLEGPWLSGEHAGAHDPVLLRPPDPAEVQAVLGIPGSPVRVVTMAPELPGALAAVEAVAAAGAVVALGHTDATYEQTRRAVRAGARLGTHLFNAMRPLHHREPGPVLALLEDPRVTVELIADGVHVHPSVVQLVVERAGPGRVALVTDAMAAAGAWDGDYRLGALDVVVRDRVARLRGRDVIAGSTLTMDSAFRFAVRCGASLAEAAAMTSATPAAVLGRPDIGSIETGRAADLVLLDDELHLQAVMSAGRWVTDEQGTR